MREAGNQPSTNSIAMNVAAALAGGKPAIMAKGSKSRIIALVGYTSARLENAVNLAWTQGHTVAVNGASIGQDGQLCLTVDGHSLPASELYRMVEPVGKDIFGFMAHGQEYEVNICYLNHGEVVYYVSQDGISSGEPRPLNENAINFVQRAAESVDGSSLRRLL